MIEQTIVTSSSDDLGDNSEEYFACPDEHIKTNLLACGGVVLVNLLQSGKFLWSSIIESLILQ